MVLEGWQQSAMQWAYGIGSWAIILLAVVLIGGLVLLIAWYRHLAKEYNKFKVVVWEQYKDKNGTEIPVFVDLNEKGRILYDKKIKRYFFHLKNANCFLGEKEGKQDISDLDIGHTPYQKGGEVVFLQKLDYKKYAVGEPFVVEGKVTVKVTMADLAEATRSFDHLVMQYGKKPNEIWAFALFIGLAVVAMIIIYLFLNKADLLKQIVDGNVADHKVLLEIVRNLNGGATASVVPG